MNLFSTKSLLSLVLFFSLFLTIPIVARHNQKAHAQSTTTVVIKNFAFSQQSITIQAGTSVTWRNDDTTAHTTTSNTSGSANSWDSSTLNPGQTYTKTFSTPGTYTYHCSLHSSMTGTIVVTQAAITPTIAVSPTPTRISTPSPTPPQNISPTFTCLGACVTPTDEPQAPTPTPKPYLITPIPTEDPCDTTITSHDAHNQDMHANAKKKKHGNGLSGIFQKLLQFILQLLGGGGAPGTPIPTITPTPAPTNEPTASPTATVTPIEPSHSPCPASPTPTGMISIDDLKYKPGSEALRKFDLIAEPLNGSSTVWTFNSDLSTGKTPGPEWRVVQGDHVRVNFINKLPEATAVHWHGVRVEASQDGVPGLTQNAVPPGGSYQYDFLVPDSGTYWYHPHQNSQQQVPKGLMGAIIVAPRIPTDKDTYQRDHTIMYHNVSGPSTTDLQALPGEKVRLRLINGRETDFSGTLLKVALVGVPFKVISLDGQDINEPQQISSQLIEMGMGNRVDLEFIMPATGSVQLLESENLQSFTIGQGTEPTIPNLNTLPVFSYLNYGVPTDDPRLPKSTFDAEYTLTLGADLSINGKLFPNVPDIIVKKDQLTKITYINNSNLTHPMHIHGQFYSVLKINGVPVTGSPIHLDTVLVKPGETAEVAVLADNEGIWMIHCHVLEHAANGMMLLNKYDNVYTPYKHGTGTGNDPH
jgi:FtsP/CotA-like multicopper oxidase with cupredoxin domain/plastocyanin